MKTRTIYYMADFAASDRRSAKAHLAGTSLRANAYVVFAALAASVGRADSAPEDFSTLSRYLFMRRKAIKKFSAAVLRVGTAVVGLGIGFALYFLLGV